MNIKEQTWLDGSRYLKPSQSIIKDTCVKLRSNLSLVYSWAILDEIILVACAVLFFVNSFFAIPYLTSWAPAAPLTYGFQCYANNLLGGLAVVAFTNLLLSLVLPEARFRDLPNTAVLILLCGIFWEYIVPFFIAGCVSDPLDLFAYEAGAFIYWMILDDLTKR